MNKLMTSVLPQNTIINGIVTKVEEDIFSVKNNIISLRAKKAFSCLVEPLVGDKVSLSIDGEDIYIIAILERKLDRGLDIVTKNGINIVAEDGDITFNAQNSINSFASKANVVISEVSLLTQIATIKSHAINLISSTYQGFIDSVTLRHKSLNKFVDGHEEHQSKSSRRVIEGSDIHQVKESITTVDGQMKIDAKLINMS